MAVLDSILIGTFIFIIIKIIERNIILRNKINALNEEEESLYKVLKDINENPNRYKPLGKILMKDYKKEE